MRYPATEVWQMYVDICTYLQRLITPFFQRRMIDDLISGEIEWASRRKTGGLEAASAHPDHLCASGTLRFYDRDDTSSDVVNKGGRQTIAPAAAVGGDQRCHLAVPPAGAAALARRRQPARRPSPRCCLRPARACEERHQRRRFLEDSRRAP